ncbi:MAG: hypothetical protein NTX25_22530 [Proteobacteria bacterium]|nr:hypothetical protein [Pseudomonadota bacterium]
MLNKFVGIDNFNFDMGMGFMEDTEHLISKSLTDAFDIFEVHDDAFEFARAC